MLQKTGEIEMSTYTLALLNSTPILTKVEPLCLSTLDVLATGFGFDKYKHRQIARIHERKLGIWSVEQDLLDALHSKWMEDVLEQVEKGGGFIELDHEGLPVLEDRKFWAMRATAEVPESFWTVNDGEEFLKKDEQGNVLLSEKITWMALRQAALPTGWLNSR